ncbi:MAG TPA: NAD-dependent epimerase/dehydratase family protein, partial [Polyangia bacterium]|nr:NAD-dependent epimerase/dehydratase family protein [Polyangia bacterium]
MQASLAAGAAVAASSRLAWSASPPSPKKILILGGTAFLGPALVAVARARGHTLTLFNRGKTNPGRFAGHADIEQLHGDRNGQLEALANRKWDAVIDDSGYVPRHVHDSATLLAPSVQHYVFVSTISVYADGSKPIDEDSPVAKLEKPTEDPGNGAYGPLKALCETAAEAAMPGRVTVVRPGLIVGPE